MEESLKFFWIRDLQLSVVMENRLKQNIIERSNDIKQLDPSVEVDAYLNRLIRTEFSDCWYRSHLSLLKTLLSKIFTVQATSASIERVFSQAGLVLSSKRSKMSERLFRELVFRLRQPQSFTVKFLMP